MLKHLLILNLFACTAFLTEKAQSFIDESFDLETLARSIIFPLPLPPESPKKDICENLSEKNYEVDGFETSEKRRILTSIEYFTARKACCEHEMTLFELQTCVDSHRRDVLNKYCTRELQHDSADTRAHPCCFSLSSQRYFCFERYYMDVMNMDSSPKKANGSDEIDAEEKPIFSEVDLFHDFTFWMDKKIKSLCSKSSESNVYFETSQNTLEDLKVSQVIILDEMGRTKEYIPTMEHHDIGLYRTKLDDESATRCCSVPESGRINCFRRKEHQLYNDYCEEKSNLCCDVIGLDRYKCFDDLFQDDLETIEPSKTEIGVDESTNLSGFTSGSGMEEENWSSESMTIVENQNSIEEENLMLDTTIFPTESSLNENTSQQDYDDSELENLFVTHQRSSMTQSHSTLSTPVDTTLEEKQEITQVADTYSKSNTKTPAINSKQDNSWENLSMMMRKNFIRQCCHMGANVAKIKADCPSEIIYRILKRSKSLPAKLSTQEAKRYCAISYQSCCRRWSSDR